MQEHHLYCSALLCTFKALTTSNTYPWACFTAFARLAAQASYHAIPSSPAQPPEHSTFNTSSKGLVLKWKSVKPCDRSVTAASTKATRALVNSLVGGLHPARLQQYISWPYFGTFMQPLTCNLQDCGRKIKKVFQC